MAHPEQQAFFNKMERLFPDSFQDSERVLEVGSQDINGSIRDRFPRASGYLGLDLSLAAGVDWTIPGELIELPDGWADICISTECFEHAQNWPRILLTMIRVCKPGGLVLLTLAGDGRAAHGTLDSEEESSPFTTTYYKNLGAEEIAEKVRLGHYFDSHGFEINSRAGDTYFWGIRSSGGVAEQELDWQSPMDRLARAQGQLGQAVFRHNEIKKERDQLQLRYNEIEVVLSTLAAEKDYLQAELIKAHERIQRLEAPRRSPWRRLLAGLRSQSSP